MLAKETIVADIAVTCIVGHGSAQVEGLKKNSTAIDDLRDAVRGLTWRRGHQSRGSSDIIQKRGRDVETRLMRRIAAEAASRQWHQEWMGFRTWLQSRVKI